jgi:hypothetical protein
MSVAAEPPHTPSARKTKGEVYESVAFAFCKVAFVAVIAQRFTLPIASGVAAVFYTLAFMNGKRDTRCWAKFPALLAAIWGAVSGLTFYAAFHPGWTQSLIHRVMR